MQPTISYTKDDIAGYECVYANYVRSRWNKSEDMCLINEHVHLKSGEVVQNKRYIKNYKRKFGITRKKFRTHNDKRTYEKMTNLAVYESTTADLPNKISQALGRGPQAQCSQSILQRSPYVYGSNISSTSLIKSNYISTFKDYHGVSQKTIAGLDLETDVLRGTGLPVSGSLTMGSKALLVVHQELIDGFASAETCEKLTNDAVKSFLGDITKARGIEHVDVKVFTSRADMMIELFKAAHEWSPDFLVIFNMDFDIPVIIRTLEEEGVDPADVFSHPSVPKEFRTFKYNRDNPRKETATGKKTSKHVADLWHSVQCSSFFYIIDQMCVYKRNRITKPTLPEYKLQAIASKETKVGKMDNFEPAANMSGIDYHIFMQSKHPIVYLAYNLMDTIVVEMVEDATSDISFIFYLNADITDYPRIGSNPRRLADAMHFFCIERGLMLASTSDNMTEPNDKYNIGPNAWIAMLPSHLTVGTGLQIMDIQTLPTRISAYIFDLDVSAAYPSGEIFMNTSKETIRVEVCKVRGRSERIQRKFGLDLCAPHVNAVEMCMNMYAMPSPDAFLDAFLRDHPEHQAVVDEQNLLYKINPALVREMEPYHTEKGRAEMNFH